MKRQCDKDRNRAWGCLTIKNDGLANKQQQKTLSVIKQENIHVAENDSALLAMEWQALDWNN